MRLLRITTLLSTAAIAAAALSTPAASAVTGSFNTGSLHADADNSAGTSGSTGGGTLGPTTYAVIGDVPYGANIIGEFPTMISTINAAAPAFTIHLGDIKNGSSRCDNSYFAQVQERFATFSAPLIYTPGDNEWTDCHRKNNGSYNPLERLATIRKDFFPSPGSTLGAHPMRVHVVTPRTPENVRWGVPGASMATVHVVGSNDGLQPWDGIGNTTATPEQIKAEGERMADAIATVTSAFDVARAGGQKAVVINLQADMFDPTYTPTWTDISAFTPFLQNLLDQSKRFDGKVYLFNGDSHVFNSDQPLKTGSPWLATYGLTGAADNLTRVTVDGSGEGDKDWLKVTVTPGVAEPVSWTKVSFGVR